jgi:hypothetical protein
MQSLCAMHHSMKTNYDMQGKDWRKWEVRGCDEHGDPRDPEHAWNQANGADNH